LFIHTWWSDTYGTINGVLWTLAVEVQFYVVFPLLWQTFRRAPWLTALGMTAIALWWRVVARQHTDIYLLQAIDNLPGYLDIFAAGMVSAYLYVNYGRLTERRGVQILGTLVSVAGFVGLVAMLENLFATRTVDQWSTVWQIVNRTWLGLAFAAIATGALFGLRFWKWILANPVTLFLGIISYNLYLYHHVIARLLVTWHVPPYTTQHPQYDHHWQVTYTWVAFTVAIAQAALVTYAFERPILRIPLSWWSGIVSRLRPARALSRP
ncbi:MAG: acyltransferase, partial [Candidatus Eremiobacteraeota bacterium]|nr:acyltransferase [Candidatus Eremiobacteraeota bacterium]